MFFQYENYNMGTSLANGQSFGNSETFTYGLNYFPHDQVVIKAEYLDRKNKNTATAASYSDEGIYSLGLGFIF